VYAGCSQKVLGDLVNTRFGSESPEVQPRDATVIYQRRLKQHGQEKLLRSPNRQGNWHLQQLGGLPGPGHRFLRRRIQKIHIQTRSYALAQQRQYSPLQLRFQLRAREWVSRVVMLLLAVAVAIPVFLRLARPPPPRSVLHECCGNLLRSRKRSEARHLSNLGRVCQVDSRLLRRQVQEVQETGRCPRVLCCLRRGRPLLPAQVPSLPTRPKGIIQRRLGPSLAVTGLEVWNSTVPTATGIGPSE
jgi:hypothetical protein